MHVIRVASGKDLPVIHRLQNIPLREQILNTPLPPYEQFFAETMSRLGSSEHYFLHETDGQPAGFVQYTRTPETCEPTVWGRWLNTLVFACAKIAFDHLNVPKLNWSVRKANKRAVQCYDRFHFRRTGA